MAKRMEQDGTALGDPAPHGVPFILQKRNVKASLLLSDGTKKNRGRRKKTIAR